MRSVLRYRGRLRPNSTLPSSPLLIQQPSRFASDFARPPPPHSTFGLGHQRSPSGPSTSYTPGKAVSLGQLKESGRRATWSYDDVNFVNGKRPRLPPGQTRAKRPGQQLSPRKPYSRGVFWDKFLGYDRPQPNEEELVARLKSELQRRDPDPVELLSACVPLLGKLVQHHLHSQLIRISSIIGGYYSSTPLDAPELPIVQKQVAEVLGVCFLRAASEHSFSKLSKTTANDTDEAARYYSEFLLHQAVKSKDDPSRLRMLHEVIVESLKLYQIRGSGYRISVPLIAAWAVLRAKREITELPEFHFIWPTSTTVIRYLDAFLRSRNEEAGDYAPAIRELMTLDSPGELPSTLQGLNTQLDNWKRDKKWLDLLNAWISYRDRLGSTVHPGARQGNIYDPALRKDVLSSFVHHLRRYHYRSAPEGSSTQIERLDEATREAIAMCPRPLPLSMHHALLRICSDAEEEPAEAEKDFNLGPLSESKSDEAQSVTKQSALDSLKNAWAFASSDLPAKDIKMYMIYLEGLEEMRDLEGLQRAWNELVRDRACASLCKTAEVDSDDSFPPTIAMNQMISACLRFPPDGTLIALRLFEQAAKPDSSTAININTVNIIIRHHARQGDVDNMKATAAFAETLGLQPDLITYTTLVQGFLRVSDLPLARSALDAMAAQKLDPNERMCSMLVSDLAHDGDRDGLSNAEDLMSEMKHRGLTPGLPSWTALISGYFRGGWTDEAWNAVKRMERTGLRLNRVAFNMILKRAAEIRSNKRQTPLVVEIFRRMLQYGIIPNSDTYFIVLQTLVSKEAWGHAEQVVEEMRTQRFTPEKLPLQRLIKRIRFKRPIMSEVYGWDAQPTAA